MEDKKKSKAFPIFVLLLGIIFVGLGVVCQLGYLDPVLENIGLKEKNTNSKSDGNNKIDNTNSTTIEEGNLDVTNEQVVTLYNKISNTKSKDYDNYYYMQDKLLVENMDNKFRLLLAFNHITSTEDTRTNEEMQNAYADLFGNLEYKAEAFDSNCREYTYDEKTLLYAPSSKASTCPNGGCNSKKEEIISAYQYADRIEITTAVAFMNTCELKYYKDYKYSNVVLEGQEYAKGILNTHKDKFDHFIYTFSLKEGKYVFVGVEKEV